MIIYAISPDFHKPPWQYVQSESAQELNSVKGKGLFIAPISIIFGQEGHLCIVNVQNTLVCNGYPVSVLPQVFHHMFCTCQGRFAIYYPRCVVCLLHLVIEQ